MEKVELGKSGLMVSEIALGTMSFSGDKSIDRSIIRSALDGGINFLDTADLYNHGEIETFLGNELSTKRKEIILGSKVGNVWNSDGKGWYWDPSPRHIHSGLEVSLQRLKTDYLDLYLLHGGTIDDPWDDIMETFQRLKKEGKIRAFGVSSIRPNVVRHLEKYKGLSAVMSQYSILDRRPEEEIFGSVVKMNAGILARGVYAKGLLLGDIASPYLEHSEQTVSEILTKLNEASDKRAALAIAFGLNPKAVTSLVIGASKPEQIVQTCQAYQDSLKIPQEIIEELRIALPVSFYQSHR